MRREAKEERERERESNEAELNLNHHILRDAMDKTTITEALPSNALYYILEWH
jgi:hypothetical protein